MANTLKLRAENLGPIEGAHDIGEIDGPGIFRLVERNAGGKSTILRALLHLQKLKLLRQDMQINDGETVASIELGPGRMTFRRGPTGEMREPERSGIDQLPPIAEMPAAIETLIHGDHLQDPDARARRRLKALLSYAPVDSDHERIAGLLATCEGRSFVNLTDDLRRTWQRLAEAAANKKKRMRVEPLRNADELREWLMAAQERDGSVLTDHGLIVEILNATANTGEHAAEEARHKLSSVAGRVEESVAHASREFGSGIRRELEGSYDLTTLREQATALAAAASGLWAERSRLTGELARREAMAQAHWERPVVVNRVDKAEHHLRQAQAHADDLARMAAQLRSGLNEMLATGRPVPHEHVEEFDALWTMYRTIASEEQLPISQLRADLESARAEFAKSTRDAERWDEVSALLSEPITGPTQEAVDAATTKAENAKRAVRIAEHAASHQVITAEHTAQLELVAVLDSLAKGYREAATDSWGYLGRILTDALDLPWLQVDGLKLFVGYVGGTLNNDHALIRAAEEAAERLALAQDHSSPVALGRFLLEAVREASDIEWRDLDDGKRGSGSLAPCDGRISTAEIHEACLSLMLARRAKLGGIAVLPWEVVAALDDDRLARFAAKVEASGLVLITERPRRTGDRDGIFLERIAAVGGAT